MRGFDAGLMPPLTYHDLELTGNNTKYVFSIDVSPRPRPHTRSYLADLDEYQLRDCLNFPMDVKFEFLHP